MSECTKKSIVSIISFSTFLLSNIGFASLVQAFAMIDCDKLSTNNFVVTAQGVEPAGKYCDFKEKLPQVLKYKAESRRVIAYRRSILKFGKPYKSRGSVCRNRGADTICLSPNSASKLNELE